MQNWLFKKVSHWVELLSRECAWLDTDRLYFTIPGDEAPSETADCSAVSEEPETINRVDCSATDTPDLAEKSLVLSERVADVSQNRSEEVI